MKLIELSSGILLNLDNVVVIHPPREDKAIVVKTVSGQTEVLSQTTKEDHELLKSIARFSLPFVQCEPAERIPLTAAEASAEPAPAKPDDKPVATSVDDDKPSAHVNKPNATRRREAAAST